MQVHDEKCPCGSGLTMAKCCLVFIKGEALPELPEQLMRSRYSAFVIKDAEYLGKTLHPSKQEDNLEDGLSSTFNSVQWLSLRVIDSHTNLKNNTGTVEFTAFHRLKNQEDQILQLHERSRFVRENAKWYYLDGDMLPDIKLGRNDLCWCGSGKKLKKCHG